MALPGKKKFNLCLKNYIFGFYQFLSEVITFKKLSRNHQKDNFSEVSGFIKNTKV